MASQVLSSTLALFILPLTFLLHLSRGETVGSITTYWGQHADEGTLADTCATGYYGTVNLAYLDVFGGGQIPRLNFDSHGVTGLSTEIKSCQSLGVKVMLTIGGTGNYTLDSDDEAREFGEYLWNNFLGGNVDGSGLLGDVILDGIDFYIAEGKTAYYGVLAETLYNLGTENNNKVYLSATPQCTFPDYWMGDALGTGLFDYVWVQYYDDSQCDYEGDVGIPIDNWNNYWTNSEKINVTQVFFGVPASEKAASSGYIEPDTLINKILPEIKKSPRYGGVMVWDRYFDLNYSETIFPYVKKSNSPTNASIATYWGQHEEERSLADVCATSCYGIVNLAYLNVFGGGQIPRVDIVHAVNSTDIKTCQSLGVKVMLTIGGTGNYTLDSDDEAREFGEYLWNNFLGGNVNGSGGLGDVILDGIDFYIAEGNKTYYGVLAETLYNLGTENNRKVYLSATPQCTFPDYWMGDALDTGLFDYIWVQYYDDEQCDYDGDESIPIDNWNKYWTNSEQINVTQVFFGVPAWEEGVTSGYIPESVLIDEILPEIKKSSKYGGLMVWDSYYDCQYNYSSTICPYLTKSVSQLAAI